MSGISGMSDDGPDERLRTPHPDVDWAALARFRAGESPEAEARAVAAWLAARPADAALLDALDGAVAAHFDAVAPAVDVEAALARVRTRRDVGPAPVPPPRATYGPAALRVERGGAHAPRRAWRAWGLGGLAAAAAIGAVLFGVDRARSTAGAEAPRQYATAIGVRDSVRLPDGTRVVLAPGSRLEVAPGYGAARREVTVEGEAFFVVTHDVARPFVVQAGGAVIRDVGTAFATRTDAAEGVAVVVTEGEVALRARGGAGDEVSLRAGDRGVVRRDGAVTAARGTVQPDDVAWTSGRVVFRDAPMAEVRAGLRRWYGLELRVRDAALADRHLTASFDAGDASRVADVIGLALGADVQRLGDTLEVRRRDGAGAPR